MAGCYARKRIVVPPTEHGVFCMKDADMSHQLCMLQQRGWIYCDRHRDEELLRCPGAYEDALVTGGDAGPAEETYGLPGVYR